MLTKSVLTATDLVDLVRAVFEQNRRGKVFTAAFFDKDGQQLPVSWMEVAVDTTGLVVETLPPPG